MARYIVLGQFTDEGTHHVNDTTKGARAVRDAARKISASVKDIYWTLGQYDIATIVDAANEATAIALLTGVGTPGNVRAECLRALSADELERMQRAGGPWIPAPREPATRR